MFQTPAGTVRFLRRAVIILALALLFTQGVDVLLRSVMIALRESFPELPPWPGLQSLLSEFGVWSYSALAWTLPLAAAALYILELALDRGIRVSGSGAHPIQHRPEAYETAIRRAILRGFEGRVSGVAVEAGQASGGARIAVSLRVRDGERGPALQDELHRAVEEKLAEMTGASTGHKVTITVSGVFGGGNEGRGQKQRSGRKGLSRNPASAVEP